MQGAPGYALDGFIRNTVVDLCGIKTIQGKATTPDLLLQVTELFGCEAGGEIAESASPFLIPHVTVPFPPPKMHASHATHVGVNFCSSENGTTHFPMQAGEDVSLRFLQHRAEGCPIR